ncbi:hypothetical protein NUW54_g9981 [Trametes sanguinea]|uniref:Uncharacterized protein n=1 Tax=Trametes sanguinea TaxID=158606 RepID=A0ACC1P5B2_9APHY|nr:hypothetical protein NUW54_g9981 [Trametes sanguinea]
MRLEWRRSSGRFDPKRFVYEEPQAESFAYARSQRAQPIQHEGRDSELGRPTRLNLSTVLLVLATTILAVCAGALTPDPPLLYVTFSTPSFFTRLLGLSSSQGQSDEITPAIQAYIDASVRRALRDQVGKRDHALHVHGGRVMEAITTPTTLQGASSSPEMALNDDMKVGMCWHVSSRSFQLGIVLSRLIYPTHISIDHIPWEIAADAGEAPRSMLLWGVVDGKWNDVVVQELRRTRQLPVPIPPGRASPAIPGEYNYVLLASFQYDIHSPSLAQTFPVDPVVSSSLTYFGILVLEVVDNWGSASTCRWIGLEIRLPRVTDLVTLSEGAFYCEVSKTTPMHKVIVYEDPEPPKQPTVAQLSGPQLI